jgi:hypothetical protein
MRDRSEIIVGALFINGEVYLRSILAKEVPAPDVAATEKALAIMITEYMAKLRNKTLDRKIN